METVEAYLSGLDGETRQMLDELRSIISAGTPDLIESIKWNAPSFACNGEDRITLGVESKGGVRLVLHRGAAKGATGDFSFADPAAVAKWPSPDRGVARFRDLSAIWAKRAEIGDICVRWIERCR